MKTLLTTTLLIVFSLAAYSQTKEAKIKKCEVEATPFKNKINQNHIYAYIAHIVYIDCLIEEFPDFKQAYIDQQIQPNINSLKGFGTLSEMPDDANTILKKYW